MIKKFFGILIVASLILSCVSVYAYPGDLRLQSKEDILVYLDIIGRHMDHEKSITRKEAVSYAVKMGKYDLVTPGGIFSDVPKDDPYAAYIETAVKNKLIAARTGTEFSPDENIKMADFLSILAASCGYGPYFDANNAIIKGKEIGLTNGLGVSANSTVSARQAMILLYNALTMNIMEISMENGRLVYERADKNLLQEIHNIVRIEGVVTANRKTSLYSDQDAVAGGIAIDGEKYSASQAFDKFLGYNVIAYIYDQTEIAVVSPDDTGICSVGSDDLFFKSGKNKIYYYTQNDKETGIAIEDGAGYFINGVYAGSFDSDQINEGTLKNGHSVYKFIDNDNDGKCELIFDNRYSYFQMSSKDKDGNYFIDSLNLQRINLLPEDTFCYEDGMAVDFQDIKYNDIIAAANPADFDYEDRDEPVEFIVIHNVVQGKARAINDETVQIGRETYSLNGINNLDNKEGSFYLDANGRIIAFQGKENGNQTNYCYFAKITTKDGIEDEFVAKVFTSENRLLKLEISTKASVYAEGERVCRGNTILDNKEQIEGKIAKIRLDDEGKIKRIDLPKEIDYEDNGEKNAFNYIQAAEYRKSGADILNDYYRLPKSAAVFIVPYDNKDDEIFEYTTVGNIDLYEDIELSLYNVDDEFTAGMAVVKKQDASSAPVGAETNIFVVQSINEAVGPDDEVTKVVHGIYNGEEKSYMFLRGNMKAKTFDKNTTVTNPVIRENFTVADLEMGDILLINTSGNIINSYRVLLDYSKDSDFARQGSDDWDDTAAWPLPYPFANKSMILAYGHITDKTDTSISYQLTVNDITYKKNIFTRDTSNIYVVDFNKKKIYTESIYNSKIGAGKRIFFDTIWGRLRDIVVYLD